MTNTSKGVSFSPKRLRSGRKAIALDASVGDVVGREYPTTGVFSPLIVTAGVSGVDLGDWLAAHKEEVRGWRHRYGAILFRGFDIGGADGFHGLLDTCGEELMHYLEATTPRTELANRIYTSTEYSADQSIALHNECSALQVWPMKLWLYCESAPSNGGETPLADVRRVLGHIPREIREVFEHKGWALVRNYGRELGQTWQTAFRTEDKAEAERYCEVNGIEWEWSGGNRLRTIQRRKATRVHPITGEAVWFNHVAFWHSSSLPSDIRQGLEAHFRPMEMPYAAFYGDLTPIDDSAIAAVRRGYERESYAAPWEAGDVILLDNMLVAHGRNPYRGERRVLVAMSEPSSVHGVFD